MTIFFTSDWHLNHRRILELSNRPFDSIEDHDQAIIESMNRMVSRGDTLVNCGDVALGPWPEGLEKVRDAGNESHKILIPGNHDRVSSIEKPARRERFESDYKMVFDEIAPEVLSMDIQGHKVTVSHYPPPQIRDHGDRDRFAEMRPVDDGGIFIHGHTHQETVVTKLDSGGLAIHVGVDSWGYRPVSEHEIIDIIEKHKE